jgi:putative endopeptidase
MNCSRIASALLLAGGVVFAASAQTAGAQSNPDKPAPPAEAKSFDLSAIDKTADPCTDFYQYACGNWDKANPIPSDQVRWARSFSLLGERNRYLLWQELDAASKDPKTPLQKKYGDYYAACMNTDLVEKQGLEPLKPAFDRIAALPDTKSLAWIMGNFAEHGYAAPLFRFGVTQDEKDSSKQIATVGQGGLSLPDRDYYLLDRFAKIRAQYKEHVTKIFTRAGDTPEAAAKEADAVLAIETALAKASMSRTDMRKPENRYHIYTVADFQKLAPDFDFSVYFKDVKVGAFETLNVSTPDFFKALNELITSEPLDAWKSYLRWHTIHAVVSNLPKAYFDENFAFFGKTMAGQREPTPRWKQCSSMTDQALGEAVGQDWVKQNFPPQAKAKMDQLVAALEKALGEDVKTLPWMSEETKKAALEKLSLIRNKIGYPDNWRSYDALLVQRDDLIGNIRRNAIFERNWNLGKLGKPVDEKEWGMTPPTVNAYYDPSMNDINFPAGILQPPFFDFSIDPAVNFGGIGVVIGHEMTHGFDDEGSKYDGHGNLREWQTAEDRKKFEERTDCEVNEYGGFETAPAHDDLQQQKLNGQLTLGENTADNGGLRIAYIALLDTLAEEGKSIDDKIDGYTEKQRYFLGFAQVWCENQTEQSRRQRALTDSHSPGKWRVNGTVQNFDEFGKAFGCKKGQPMYPENSCRVW